MWNKFCLGKVQSLDLHPLPDCVLWWTGMAEASPCSELRVICGNLGVGD